MKKNLEEGLRAVAVEETQVEEIVKNFFLKINSSILDALVAVLPPEGDTKLKEGIGSAKSLEESSILIEDLTKQYNVDLETIRQRVSASAGPAAWKMVESKLTPEQWQKFIQVL